MEDGRVIADSGPQISSASTEDSSTEEESKDSRRKPSASSSFPAILSSGHLRVPGSDHVILDEVTSSRQKVTSTRKEHAQYHDEGGVKTLSGFEVHKKAICAPNELLALIDDSSTAPRGQMVNYSVNGSSVKELETRSEQSTYDAHTGAKRVSHVTQTTQREVSEETEEPEEHLAGNSILPESRRETQSHSTFYGTSEDDEDGLRAKVIQVTNRVHSSSDHCRQHCHQQPIMSESPDPGVYSFTKRLSSSSDNSITRLDGNRIRIEMSSPDHFAAKNNDNTTTSTANSTFFFGLKNNNNDNRRQRRSEEEY